MRTKRASRTDHPQRRLKTDTGTIVLHWSAVAAIVVNLVTGFAIAADGRHHEWVRMLRGLLPQGEIWRLHVISGVALLSVAAAYAAYLFKSGLSARVRLDKARLYSLRLKGRARWAAINILLYWLVFALLITQIATGALLYAGYGGVIVSLHFWAAVLVLAYPVVHVLAQYCFGHVQQLLRILTPGPLVVTGRPPKLAELMRAHFENSAQTPPPASQRSTLKVHPLSIAIVAGLAAATFASVADKGLRDKLVIASIAPAAAPVLDGDLADPVWRHAPLSIIETQQGANLGNGTSKVTVRAVHDGTTAYFAFTWEDPTRSLKHLPLIKRDDGWHLLHTRYDIEDEDSYYEDKFAVMLAESSQMPAAGAIQLGTRPLADGPPALSGRGLHYTTDGSIVDVWHWKAARGGLLGGVDDNYFGPPKPATDAEAAGKSRYKAGYQADTGKAAFSNNFDAQPPGGYKAPLTPKRLPKDLAALQKAMGPINLDPEMSERAGTRWWMMLDETEPFTPERDRAIPVGTILPGVLINGDYGGDRGDVRCGAIWSAGRWTLEIARRLDTGSKHDVAIRSGTAMWVSAFDHSQTRHTRHMRPLILELETKK